MRSVLVTGTSTGIGEHTAIYLLSQPDVKVIGVARRAAPDSIASNENYTHVQGDLTDEGTISKVKDVVGSHLDGAVFNAGILDSVTKLANTDLGAFRKVFEINVFAVVALAQALIPALRAAHGRAIFVSSGASTNGYQAWAAYGASKAALNLIVKTLAVEEPHITSVSVAPGVVDTSMQTDIRSKHVVSGEMGDIDSVRFAALKSQNKLVDPKDSGALYGRLALSARHEWSGNYYRYSDPVIN